MSVRTEDHPQYGDSDFIEESGQIGSFRFLLGNKLLIVENGQ